MEVNSAWRKSSYSGGSTGNCVEVATANGGIAVRDSQNPDGPVLLLTPGQWAALARSVLGDTAPGNAESPQGFLGGFRVCQRSGSARPNAGVLKVVTWANTSLNVVLVANRNK